MNSWPERPAVCVEQPQGGGTIDACIAVGVRRRRDAIATSDPADMRTLLGPGFTILAV
jgi:hypothetical protein